ncbi:thymidylate kinase-like isoform X2 [Acanthaster planci]|uniref:Thymidylate kinase-like isoform X2 n=1 Tax=Acanthaster planci TaxID=133434 RepID=A0A8B7Z3R7_ACAPL|nr:thymidylate kinase-like isoform X2 [Acanthaster planci]
MGTSGIDLCWCKQPEVGLPKPDLVFFLDIRAGDAENRANFGEERYESALFQSKVKDIFYQLKDSSWKVLDGSQGIEDIHHLVLPIAEDTIDGDLPNPMDKLWS